MLTVENEEAERLATELAALTGSTIEDAVVAALRARLAHLRGRSGLAEHLLAIGRECAAAMPEPFRSIDHGELLYDERGLPK